MATNTLCTACIDLRLVIIFSIAGYCFTLVACSSLPSASQPKGKPWGEQATLFPTTERLKHAAVSAIRHPGTWGPALGAVIFTIDDWDQDISAQASDTNPLFGSKENAGDASDVLRDSLEASVAITLLLTPSGDTVNDWWRNKFKGAITELGALKATSLSTGLLKDLSQRERPNGINDASFPSGHTSSAFAAAALSSKNLDSLTLNQQQKTGIRLGLYSFAAGTAWARVEAQMHYPVDVLAGAALGNFIARFIHDAFLGLNEHNAAVRFVSHPQGSYFVYQQQF